MADRVNKFMKQHNSNRTSTDEIVNNLYENLENEEIKSSINENTNNIEETVTVEKLAEIKENNSPKVSKSQKGEPKKEKDSNKNPEKTKTLKPQKKTEFVTESIHVKVTEEQRKKIGIASSIRQMTSSEYIRLLIEEDLKKNYKEYEQLYAMIQKFSK